MVQCSWCQTAKASLRRPKTGHNICKPCFFEQFEEEVHQTIMDGKLFKRGDRVAIAASGGKDSTVLAEVLSVLNKRHDYGLDLFLLSVDEGITGYRDDSLESVKRNQEQYQIPLKIVSYKELYGWTMDEIVKEIGLKNNCTFCGVFRRQALDRGAMLLKADQIVTGHNADDIAETVLMNLLRGDVARLGRCVSIITGKGSSMPRTKPFKYTYEKEIVMYAYYKELDYFSTECIYSPFAYRGYAREFLKDLEKAKSRSIIDIIRSAEEFVVKADLPTAPKLGSCVRCGYISSNKICKACVLLEGLSTGKARVAVTKGNREARRGVVEVEDGKSPETPQQIHNSNQRRNRKKADAANASSSSDAVPTGLSRRQQLKQMRYAARNAEAETKSSEGAKEEKEVAEEDDGMLGMGAFGEEEEEEGHLNSVPTRDEISAVLGRALDTLQIGTNAEAAPSAVKAVGSAVRIEDASW